MTVTRPPALPSAKPCPLCGPLAKANIHHDAAAWGFLLASAEERLAEAQRDVDKAKAHIRHLTPDEPAA